MFSVLCFFVLISIPAVVPAQEIGVDSVKIPAFSPLNRSFYDLNRWYPTNRSAFNMSYFGQKPDLMKFYTQPRLPANPWELDMRNTSFYTPRMVRDELNLIMNRPRENAFVPVLGAAFIAYQLARDYLIIQKKLVITPDDILSCQDELSVLQQLWYESPQTCSQLFNHPEISKDYTYNELQQALSRLADKNLIKIKQIENAEPQNFPAISSVQMRDILQNARSDTMLSEDKAKQIVPLLIKYQGLPK